MLHKSPCAQGLISAIEEGGYSLRVWLARGVPFCAARVATDTESHVRRCGPSVVTLPTLPVCAGVLAWVYTHASCGVTCEVCSACDNLPFAGRLAN